MILEEEDMEVVEDTKAVEATEAEEGVEEHLAKDEDRLSIITVDNKVTSHETVRRLPVTIIKL
jgi:predicted ribosome-associated RNA-binding protein Tma20